MVPEAALRANACSLMVGRILSFGLFVEEPDAASSVRTQTGEMWGSLIPESRGKINRRLTSRVCPLTDSARIAGDELIPAHHLEVLSR